MIGAFFGRAADSSSLFGQLEIARVVYRLFHGEWHMDKAAADILVFFVNQVQQRIHQLIAHISSGCIRYKGRYAVFAHFCCHCLDAR